MNMLWIVVLVIGLSLFTEWFRRRALKQLLNEIYEAAYVKKDEELFKLYINSPQAKMLMSTVTRLIMKLNYSIAKDQMEKVKKLMPEIEGKRMNNKEALSYYQTVFGYMAEREQAEEATHLLTAMKERFGYSKDASVLLLLFDCELIYDIYICKDATRKKDLEILIHTAPDAQSRSVYQYRMAKVAHIIKDQRQCIAYLKQAQENTQSLAAKNKIDRILNGEWALL